MRPFAEFISGLQPLHRQGVPEDIADAAVYSCCQSVQLHHGNRSTR